MSLEKINYIRSKVSTTDMLVQVAEECNELSAAVLKLIRKLNGENPTPKTDEEIKANIQEEMTDVLLCMDVLGELYIDKEQYSKKLDRWTQRLKSAEENRKCLNCKHFDRFAWRCEEKHIYSKADEVCDSWEVQKE